VSLSKFISVFKEQDLGLLLHFHYRSFIARALTLTKVKSFQIVCHHVTILIDTYPLNRRFPMFHRMIVLCFPRSIYPSCYHIPLDAFSEPVISIFSLLNIPTFIRIIFTYRWITPHTRGHILFNMCTI